MVFMAGQVVETKAGGWDWGTYGGGWFSGQEDCPDCPDAWSKQLTEDRFERVMPTEANPDGEGVLDHETCLVWEQSPETSTPTWLDAIKDCYGKTVGARKGWRLPTVEELATLVDDTNGSPKLPSGNPFDPAAVMSSAYWTITTVAGDPAEAHLVSFTSGRVGSVPKDQDSNFWCVRGGHGYDTY